jgi:hypothetical protein
MAFSNPNIAVVQPILNTTLGQVQASLANPAANEGYTNIFVIGANAGASTSLAVPTQGACSNPVYRESIPQCMNNLYSSILQSTLASYLI